MSVSIPTQPPTFTYAVHGGRFVGRVVSQCALEGPPTYTAYKGERGGTGWKNTSTGKVAYVEKMPGGDSSAVTQQSKSDTSSQSPLPAKSSPKQAEQYGGWKPEWSDSVAPKDFIASRNNTTRKGFLSPITESDLSDHKIFLSSDGKVGSAVSRDGDIQNVFNNGGPTGAGAEAVLSAMRNGGNTLDCYAGHLSDFYTQFGFEETGRMKFNRDFAPPDWDYDKHGEPDVVFMSLSKENYDEQQLRALATGSKENWRDGTKSTRYYDDGDQAKADSRGAVGRGSRGASGGTGVGGQERRPDPGPSEGDREPVETHANVSVAVGDIRGVKSTAKKVFGKHIEPSDLADLVGARGDVKIGFARLRPAIVIQMNDSTVGLYAERIVERDADGKIFITNELLTIGKKHQGRGIGTQILVDQVREAVKMGVDRIELHAETTSAMNGGYTWARLGFDGPLPDTSIAKLKADDDAPDWLKTATTVHELFVRPGGREWWMKNHESFHGTFDLKEGSLSRRILDGYIEARREGGGGAAHALARGRRNTRQGVGEDCGRGTPQVYFRTNARRSVVAKERFVYIYRSLSEAEKASWTAYSGPRGGDGWKNASTGEVNYQDDMPGGSESPKVSADDSPVAGNRDLSNGTGHKTPDENTSGTVFISPSVDDIDLPEAVRRLNSERQVKLTEDFKEIDEMLGIGGVVEGSIGAWKDGAENATVTTYSKPVDFETLLAVASIKGSLANQKAVLAFQNDEDGPDFLMKVEVDSQDYQALNESLLRHGVQNHTMLPKGNKTVVLAYTSGAADNAESRRLVSDGINAFAGEYDGVTEYQTGRGEFPGDPAWSSREDAQSDYERRIYRALEIARIPESVVAEWRRMRDYWLSDAGQSVRRTASEILIGQNHGRHPRIVYSIHGGRLKGRVVEIEVVRPKVYSYRHRRVSERKPADAWSPYRGQYGGTGWVNAAGDVRYQTKKPGDDDSGKPQVAAPAKKPRADIKFKEPGTFEKPDASRLKMQPAKKVGSGKDAKIVLSNGKDAPDHIQAIVGKIPPAWTDIEVSLDKKSNVLASGMMKNRKTGKDETKTIYNQDTWTSKVDAIKFARVREGLRVKSIMQNEIGEARQNPKTRDAAELSMLMMENATRPGSDGDTKGYERLYGKEVTSKNVRITPAGTVEASRTLKNDRVELAVDGEVIPLRDKKAAAELKRRVESGAGLEDSTFWLKSFGATTLEARHVVVDGDEVRLEFMGKESVWNSHVVKEPEVAAMLIARKNSREHDAKLFDADEKDVNKFIRKLDGGHFTAKDLRTMKATELGIAEVAKRPAPTTEAEFDEAVNAVATVVSGTLGNRDKQALASYIDPAVFHAWRRSAGV